MIYIKYKNYKFSLSEKGDNVYNIKMLDNNENYELLISGKDCSINLLKEILDDEIKMYEQERGIV